VEIADEGTARGGYAMEGLSRAAGDASLVLDPQQQTVQAAVTVRVTITEPDLTS
jgi:hypothetical protein